MEKYLKMSDVFFATVDPKQLSGWKHQGRYVELKRIQEAAAHAINSHDELVAMNKELLAALEAAVECGMVPTSSAMEGGAMKYVRQAHVADQIRSAIAKAKAAS